MALNRFVMRAAPRARFEHFRRAARQALQALTLVFMAAFIALPAAHAQTYPNKPIRLVVPFAPGGSADGLARIYGQMLGEALGQSVVVDNRPGGNLIIGTDAVAKSPADGYTLLMTLDIAMTMNPSLYSKLPYQPEKDFAPISLLGQQAVLLVSNPKLPVKTMGELVAYAKKNPGKVTYGSGAIVGQVVGEMLHSMTGTQMVYVPFKGSQLALNALLAGDIDLAIADFAPFLQYIEQGKLIGLATTGTQRESVLPKVPTAIEQGYPNFEAHNWFGVFAPAGTPQAIVDKLNAASVRITASPTYKEKLQTLNLNTASSTPAELAATVKSDTAKWGKIIKAAGIHFD